MVYISIRSLKKDDLRMGRPQIDEIIHWTKMQPAKSNISQNRL